MPAAPPAAATPELARFAELDARMVAAARPIRLLQAVSWPADQQALFLERWRRGHHRLPEVEYSRPDLGDARAELEAVQREADPAHPIGLYLQRTAASWLTAADLLGALGSADVTRHSIALFGRPGDPLPGSELSNLDAARHFIDVAEELDRTLGGDLEASHHIPAEQLRGELQAELDRFFTRHSVRVEIDPGLIAKAAAGPTRIRLRGNTAFSEYDRHQLLEHEAFVHTLTALNGREQPLLGSLARNSPRTTATQEGLATFAELITGAIDITRMKRISLRIVAIDAALRGADFVEVFALFLGHGQTPEDSFASAQRVFRGCPVTGGAAFTKDTVYLHGLLGVHTFFRWALRHQRPRLAQWVFAGKMTLQDAFAFEPLFEDGTLAAPAYLPPWVQRAQGLAGMLAFSLFANRIRLDRVDMDDLVLGR